MSKSKSATPKLTSKDKVEKINLGDSAGLKRKLDETVIEVVTSNNYLEEFFVSNVKIALGIATVSVALIAHFYPQKYPDNWLLLLACVNTYAILNGLLNIFVSKFEGDAIMLTKPPRVGGSKVGLKVTSKLPRFSDQYTLTIASRAENCSSDFSFTKSITQYFHEDGYIAKDKLTSDVEGLLREYEKKKSS